MRTIQIFGREKAKGKEFIEKSEELYQAHFREIFIDAVFRPATYLTYVCALVVLLLAGASGVISGSISIGMLYVFVQYIDSFYA